MIRILVVDDTASAAAVIGWTTIGARAALRVPASEESAFLRDAYPALARRVPVRTVGAVELGDLEPHFRVDDDDGKCLVVGAHGVVPFGWVKGW